MKEFLLRMLVGCVVLFSLGGLYLDHSSAQKGSKAPPTAGKAVAHKRTELQKFSRPIATVPRFRPDVEVRGHVWRWSSLHGWVALPVGTAPATVLLPADFALPETVTVYETAPLELVPGEVIHGTCPHCGAPIQFHLRKR